MNTNPHAPNPERIRRSPTGMALLSVVIFTTAIALIVGSLLEWGVQDQGINSRHFVLLDAKNAAESATELAVGVLTYRWESQASVPENDLRANPLEDEPAVANELAGHFPDERYSFDVKGGSVTQGRYYVHPDDPAHEDDPHKGKLVTIQSVTILAKAAVDEPSLSGPITAYARQTLQVRDAPLFSHAVFYNMDLEFHPGPVMEMNGPVHANGDIWVQAKNRLTFTSNLTATGDFRYGYMLNSDNPNPVTQSGTVLVNDGVDGYASPYRGSGWRGHINNYWDSQSPTSYFQAEGFQNWGDFSMNRWNGNLQDASHEVPVLNPIGYDDYVRDDPDTPTPDDDLNYAYALIEPNITDASGPTGGRNPVHKGEGEKEKFAYKAGLIVRLHYSEDGETTSDGSPLPDEAVRLHERIPIPEDERANPDDPLDPSSTLNNFEKRVAEIEAEIEDDIENHPELWPHPDDPGIKGPPSNYYVSFLKIDRDDPHNLQTTKLDSSEFPALDADGNPVIDEEGNPVMETVETVREIQVQPDLSDDWRNIDFHDMFAIHPYREDSGGDPESSMFDQRRQTGVDLFEINYEVLGSYIEDDDAHGLFGSGSGSVPAEKQYSPGNDFNGVLYVEFPTDPRSIPGHDDYEERPDRIVPSVRESPRDEDVEMGLILTQTGRIPDPAYNKTSGRDEGFTLAANNAIYVKGHYNADGDPATGTNTAADGTADWDPNPPAALVGDAVMPLSPGFGFLGTDERSADASGFTEFNAAVIQGLRPTDKEGDGEISGGNHNFPRFLEDWGGVEFRYRGSMVALFESEIAPQGTDTAYYSPPNRNWGFYQLFADGVYPPGTPNVRSFRKTNFRFLTKVEYEELLAEMED
ncbi:MAG: hypothetical protein ACLFRP_00725 [Puniceicoccaceae bacterium]